MNNPIGPSGRSLEVTADEVWRVAAATDDIAETVATTNGTVTAAASTAASSAAGWDCAAYVNGATHQWERKVDALTAGPNGFTEYADSLRRFLSVIADADRRNASGIDVTAGINGELGGEYEPEASGDVHKLLTGTPPPTGGR